MELTIVTTQAERDEMKATLDAYADLIGNGMTKEEFKARYPRKVWLDTEECSNRQRPRDLSPFLVVDNREGECFAEGFDTLDGALLYATDVYMTTERQSEWDYLGAVEEGGDIRYRLEEGDAAPRDA